MPLNLEPRTSDFTPYMKYNAKAGRWYTKTDAGDEVEVRNMTAIFDLENIKTGWILFVEGGAPDHVWDSNGSMAPAPTPKHKRGFSVNAFSPKELGGLRELSSTSNAAIIAIKELYNAWENAPEAKRGLVPVVTSSPDDIVPVKSKQGTNYQPVLKISRWVPRPDALKANGNGNGSANGNGTAAHAEARQIDNDPTVPPPVASTAAVAETSAEEF